MAPQKKNSAEEQEEVPPQKLWKKLGGGIRTVQRIRIMAEKIYAVAHKEKKGGQGFSKNKQEATIWTNATLRAINLKRWKSDLKDGTNQQLLGHIMWNFQVPTFTQAPDARAFRRTCIQMHRREMKMEARVRALEKTVKLHGEIFEMLLEDKVERGSPATAARYRPVLAKLRKGETVAIEPRWSNGDEDSLMELLNDEESDSEEQGDNNDDVFEEAEEEEAKENEQQEPTHSKAAEKRAKSPTKKTRGRRSSANARVILEEEAEVEPEETVNIAGLLPYGEDGAVVGWNAVAGGRCEKLAEGSATEIYRRWDGSVMKIIPISAANINQVQNEVVVNWRLGSLPEPLRHCFAVSTSFSVVRGGFPKKLLDEWRTWKELPQNDCENPEPKEYGPGPFAVMVMPPLTGLPLEQFVCESEGEQWALWATLAVVLLNAESAAQFEHRDAHGNNLHVERVGAAELEPLELVVAGGRFVVLRKHRVTFFDYGLSRVQIDDGRVQFVPMEKKETRMGRVGVDTYADTTQFDIYKRSWDHLSADWGAFCPRTNAMWAYLLARLIFEPRAKLKLEKGEKKAAREWNGENSAFFAPLMRGDTLRMFLERVEVRKRLIDVGAIIDAEDS